MMWPLTAIQASARRPHSSTPSYRRIMPLARTSQARAIIETAVSQVFGIGLCELVGATRGRARAAHARQVAMYLAHVALGYPMKDVGRLFARDRTTVAHACGVIEDCRDDPDFDHCLAMLEWSVVQLLRSSHSGQGPTLGGAG